MTRDLLEECSKLYSEHYGRWSLSASSPDQPIRLSAARLRDWLDPDSSVAFARVGDALVGYAICVRSKVKDYGFISWVTQLVLHRDYRQQDVGKTLLFSSWSFTDHYAWGLISANPYAVRALEKATRRRCVPQRISKNRRKLLTVGRAHVPYLKNDVEMIVDGTASRVNTEFFVDHSGLPQMLESASRSTPWLLGDLPDGWEWLAFTFHDQEQFPLTSQEISRMLEASDEIVRVAYSRMRVQDAPRWTRHADREVQLAIDACSLVRGSRVLDLGCGTGRHVLALARRGMVVTGIDYVDRFIEIAAKGAAQRDVEARFLRADCRDVRLQEYFDAVLCLYDVVGTYANEEDNRRILATAFAHLRPGGFLLLSVMNFELTRRQATQFFSLATSPDRLLELQASRTMETTGDVFDPHYYMIDTDTNVVYRKEQFASGGELPVEVVVRDRRFTREEIRSLCESVGLEVIWSRRVRAGDWEADLPADSERAKEILVLCRRPECARD